MLLAAAAVFAASALFRAAVVTVNVNVCTVPFLVDVAAALELHL